MNTSSLKSLYNIEAVQTINEFKETDSTNARAKEDIRNFIDDEEWTTYNVPSLYIADIQTAGRGRSVRTWESENETGIWMSYLFAPKLSPEQIPSVTLLASLAVAEAITEYAERHNFNLNKVQIKWPNDIIINKKKVCGILTELVAPNYVICGIGVNVNSTSFDASLSDKATGFPSFSTVLAVMFTLTPPKQTTFSSALFLNVLRKSAFTLESSSRIEYGFGR